MGVAEQFSKHLHRQVGAHAAWLPVANNFELGDYGLVSNGVFNRMGNVREFGLNVDGIDSEPIKLDFRSEGTRVVSIVGEGEVSALPPEPQMEAKVRIEFSKSDSYYAKAEQASVREIPNLREVAKELADAGGWKSKYRVVWATVTGRSCVIVTSKAANANFELNGKVGALQQLGVGALGADVKVSSEKDVGLSIVGETGVIGLKLFKLKWWGDEAKLLGPEGEAEIEKEEGDALEDDV